MSEQKTTFDDLNLNKSIMKALSHLGYEMPSPVQAAAIPVMMNGEDIRVLAQTGTGKTAAFALPVIARLDDKAKKPQVLVLTPTRELAIQVSEAFAAYARFIKNFHVLPIYGGQDYSLQIRQLRRGPQVVVGTPGRTLDHLRKGTLNLSEVTTMILDEADEMLQMAVGLMGMFVIHPKKPEAPPVNRDFAIMLHEWAVHPGTYRPDPAVMLDFNHFTFNGKVFPATEPLVVRTGDRVRIRLGNLSMNQHPIHLHGYSFNITATDGGRISPSAQWPQTTVPVPVGSTRDIEFVADVPGDWAFHCHKSHHTMNAMGHDLPNMMGVDQAGVEKKIRALLPGYMAMGEKGMAGMQGMAGHMPAPGIRCR